MRRSLVLSDETRRHSFLASLPPHVRVVEDEAPVGENWRLSLTRKDWRDIALTYVAGFLAVSTFMA